MNTIPKQINGSRQRRRIHSAEFKAQVVAACCHPGVSIAAVAMANGVNANLARRWIVSAEQSANGGAHRLAPANSPAHRSAFVPVTLPASRAAPQQLNNADIRIDLRRGATLMTITWPSSAAADCAAWMRELLR